MGEDFGNAGETVKFLGVISLTWSLKRKKLLNPENFFSQSNFKIKSFNLVKEQPNYV